MKHTQDVEVAVFLDEIRNRIPHQFAAAQRRHSCHSPDQQLKQFAADHPVVQQLMTIPGVGVTTATALFGSVPDIRRFSLARQFSAWLGLTPREFSADNKPVLGRISKRGDKYLRMLLIPWRAPPYWLRIANDPAINPSPGLNDGPLTCSNSGTTTSPRWRWPTKWPGSSGPSGEEKPTTQNRPTYPPTGNT